jgi:hypothetical protein
MRIALIVFLMTLLAACSGIETKRATYDYYGTSKKQPCGVLVQPPTPHQLMLYYPSGTGTVTLAKTTAMLPSQDEVYDVTFTGGLFAKRTLKVTKFGNGAMKGVTWQSEDQTAQALDKFAASAGKVNEFLSAKAAAEAQASQAASQAEGAAAVAAATAPEKAAKAQLRQLMLQANLEAAKQGKPLPYADLSSFN